MTDGVANNTVTSAANLPARTFRECKDMDGTHVRITIL
jgi:hypothetical protein